MESVERKSDIVFLTIASMYLCILLWEREVCKMKGKLLKVSYNHK